MLTLRCLYFQDREWEAGDFAFADVREWIFFAGFVDISSMPVIRIATWSLFIQCIFPYQCDITIQIDPHRIIAGNLECRASICNTED
jgi:hypothetical protein